MTYRNAQTARSVAPGLVFAAALAGIGIFSSMDAVMKGLVIAIGVYNAMFWRTLAGVALSGALYAGSRPSRPSAPAMRLHLVRGGVTAVMAVLFFWGLARVPMAQAIALSFVAPVLALFLAAALLHERIAKAAILASVLALAGVGVIVAGQAHERVGPDVVRGTLAILASSVCYAFNIVLMRAQAQIAGPIEVAFWQSLIVTAAFALAAPWLLSIPDVRHAPLLVLGAVLATLSLLLLSWAYARGEAGYLAPTEYSGFLWASLFGWLVFGERLTAWTVGGAALIVAGCALATRGRASPVSDTEAMP